MKSLSSRHMSLSLALRYLNPLRTYFSVITLICLMGVSLGVMVLIIVLSVMGGLQKELQDRLLAFSPHLQVNYYAYPGMRGTLGDWRDLEKEIRKAPGVESTYAVIEDYALVDVHGAQRPCMFRALDTENELQMQELAPLLREGSFDLGVGENVVVSSSVAKMFGLSLDDTICVYTTRNFENVSSIYSQIDRALLVDRFPKEIAKLLEIVKKDRPVEKNQTVWSGLEVQTVISILDQLSRSGKLEVEEKQINAMWDLLPKVAFAKDGNQVAMPADITKRWVEAINALKVIDKNEEDLKAMQTIKSLVLPKDLTVIGIYQDTKHVACPDLFIPLEIGQELQGFQDDYIQAIAIRAENPYDLKNVVDAVYNQLPGIALEGASWKIETWMDRYSSWFSLIRQERMMMSFVLSFIGLIAAFCMMAVMFTVSIQRRKELALMKALGATPWQVVRVFLWQGVIIGIAGALLGVALGLLALHYRAQIHMFLKVMGVDPFPMDFHGVEIPAEIDPAEIGTQALQAFVMVVIASVVPALCTAWQDPAKALRSM